MFLLLPSLTICLDIKLYVLATATVYSKKSKTQSVKKQVLTKYWAEQNCTYQIDSLKKEANKKLFTKADSLVIANLSCPSIKLSELHTSISGCEKRACYCQNLLKNHVVKTQTLQTFTFFSTLVVYLQFWFWIKMTKSRKTKLGLLRKQNARSPKSCTHRWRSSWVCANPSET